LKKSKTRYKNSKKCDRFCKSGYCEKNGNEDAGNTLTILRENINLQSYPMGKWHEIKATFIAPESSFDWLVIELEDNADNCDTYILIDDVTISLDCETCSRTSGCIEPISNNVHDIGGNWFRVNNLQNVFKAELYIYDISGTSRIRKIDVESINGITEPIYWDGKNEGGQEVAPSNYLWYLKAWNDCDQLTTEIKSFPKNNGPILTPPPPVFNYNMTNKSPKPCCLNDIYIHNTTLFGPGIVEYQAASGISVADNVNFSFDATVVFRATNEIIGFGQHNVDFGADITAEIVPCNIEGSGMALENTDYLNHSLEYSQWDNEFETEDYEPVQEQISSSTVISNLSSQNQATIFPNPTTGKFTVNITGYQLPKNVLVLNSLGQIIYEIKEFNGQIDIDLSPFSPGIYFAKISDGETVKIEKVVYQR
jgi:hypothetical protein